jgi:type VI secretion system secreted protein Hcp
MAYGDMFLKLTSAKGGEAKGEAQDSVHGGEIDILAFSWGMKAASAMGAAGPAARSSLDSLRLTKQVDRASTALMSVMRANDVVSEAVLTVRKAGGSTPVDYIVVTIKQGRITSYDLQTNGAGGLLEQLTLSFQSIEIAYTGQDTTGVRTGASTFTAETN